MTEAKLLEIGALHSITLAILLLFVGRELTRRLEALRRYSIPEAVAGGVACAVVVGVCYYLFNVRIEFDLELRTLLLLYFFSAIGLESHIGTLLKGGRPLVVLTLLATAFIVVQNLVGMTVAGWFGMDPRAGLMTGSISLVGGVGTTLAWTPQFVQQLGIGNAEELGLSANMIGMVAACAVGGPIASVLMRSHPEFTANKDKSMMIGVPYEVEQEVRLDYESVLRAIFWLNNALLLGQGITALMRWAGLVLPDFVGCLMAGIVIRNTVPHLLGRIGGWNWPSLKQGLSLVSDICLGLFLTMALMGLRAWELEGVVGFVFTVMALQILLAIVYTRWIVFRAMGGDYEAVVISAGFGGIALGSTATAVANMTAVSRQYGAATRAFIIVPLVCGFFIDLINALIINRMI